MAYEKQTWVSGVTKCSAENFNHMEDGIETAQKGVDELNTNMFKVFAPIYNGSVLQVAIKPGIYTYNDGTTDKPSNAVAGMVIVKEAGNWMIRLAVDANGNIFTSIYKPGKDWGTWEPK